MEDLVFRRPRKVNQFGTFPLAFAGALLMQLPGAVYQAAILAVTVPACVLAARAGSTVVTARGITVRALRGRFIPWEQVDAITLDDPGGVRSIELRLSDGSRHRLPAPVERHWRAQDPSFDDKYAAIMQAWLRSSGPAAADGEPGRSGPRERGVSRRTPESPTR